MEGGEEVLDPIGCFGCAKSGRESAMGKLWAAGGGVDLLLC